MPIPTRPLDPVGLDVLKQSVSLTSCQVGIGSRTGGQLDAQGARRSAETLSEDGTAPNYSRHSRLCP